MLHLRQTDVLVLARPRVRRRSDVRQQWLVLGVARHRQFADAIAAVFAAREPEHDVRVIERGSLARELGHDERDAVLDHLYNPTLGAKRRQAELRKEALSASKPTG